MAIVVVSGVPGAGKSSVARALAARWQRGVHLDSDTVGEAFVVSGAVLPGEQPADEAERQLALRRDHLVALANSFSAAGFGVVIDDVVLWPALFERYRRGLIGAVRLVVLAPTLDVVARRDAARHKHVFGTWRHLDDDLRRWTDQPGLRLDTSELDLDATVAAIVERWDEALVPSAGESAGHDAGGDPACWLDQICDTCGQLRRLGG